MPAERFFFDDSLDQPEIILEGEELRHLKVMRLQEGEDLEIINGRGQLAMGKVSNLEKRHATIHIINKKDFPKASFELIVAQAIPRASRLDLIVEKGTELGMTQLWLFPGDRSERPTLSPTQQKRVRHLSIAAIKQCGRLHLPELHLLPPLKRWDPLKLPSFFGDLDPDAPPFEKLWKENPPQKGFSFIIGPESGLSKKEEALCRELGAKGVKLHSNILRTDTAPLVVLSLASHWRL